MAERPLVLLDVDGVLNALALQPGPAWEHHTCQNWNGSYRVRLNPSHGPMLLKLAEETGAELVWATTWCDDANKQIGPKVGLPELPVIDVLSGDEEPWVNPKVPPVAEQRARRAKTGQERPETVPHGRNGYENYGCRCPKCKAARAAAQRERRARKPAPSSP